MLQTLRNDRIYPYFWSIRAKSAGSDEFNFLDLNALKSRLQKSPCALCDLDFEKRIYGSADCPHFSGWTIERLTRVLQRSGFARPELIKTTELVSSVKASTTEWTAHERRKTMSWRGGQRIWAFRKRLRQKTGELLAKAKAIRNAPDLRVSGLCLNLGAGGENYDGYIKVDLSGAQHVYDNIITLTRIPNGSVARIYCNHVLEHIPVELIEPMLRRWREILQPDGRVLVRTPDARQAVLHLNEKWVETTEQELERLGFPNFLEREPAREGVLDDDSCIQSIYGWSDSTPHSWDMSNQHKSLWTPGLARERFEKAGFTVEYAENLGTLNTALIARR